MSSAQRCLGRARCSLFTLSLLLAWITACGGSPSGEDPDGGAGGDGSASSDGQTANTSVITILHTSDEHGWLEARAPGESAQMWGGAALLMGRWNELENLDLATHLVLSSGDNWAGSRVSTWLDGAPAVDVLGEMGYAASALGDYESYLGRTVLEARAAQAAYPLLAANVVSTSTGLPPDFLQPYALYTIDGVSVAVVGLAANVDDCGGPHCDHLQDLSSTPYVDALRDTLPEVRGLGAQVIVVLAHVCAADLAPVLASPDIEVDALLAGRCHEPHAEKIDGVPLLSGGATLWHYGRLRLHYDRDAGQVTGSEMEIVPVVYGDGEPSPAAADPDITARVSQWRADAEATGSRVIGYTESGIARGSWAMVNLVADCWLWAFPEADIAVLNFGAMKNALPPGDVTLALMSEMMPFDDALYSIELTGAQLILNLAVGVDFCTPMTQCYPAVGGIRFFDTGGQLTVEFLDQRPFDPQAVYRVLVNDFMYLGGDGYLFSQHDPEPYRTGFQARIPVETCIADLETSAAFPLDLHLDVAPRDE